MWHFLPLCNELNREQRQSALKKKAVKISMAVKRKLKEIFSQGFRVENQASHDSSENDYNIFIQ